MVESDETDIGLRERKREETFARIAEASLKLFVERGYEQTTLDDIAAAAGISRRTFFYYFKAKDDILIGVQCDGFIRGFAHMFDGLDTGTSPFDAVAERLPVLVTAFETPESIVITSILKSTEALRVRKQAGYVEMETGLFDVLRRVWPDAAMVPALTLVATASISVLRLAIDQWHADGAIRPVAGYVCDGFALLRDSVGA